jgi:hypothetical protein
MNVLVAPSNPNKAAMATSFNHRVTSTAAHVSNVPYPKILILKAGDPKKYTEWLPKMCCYQPINSKICTENLDARTHFAMCHCLTLRAQFSELHRCRPACGQDRFASSASTPAVHIKPTIPTSPVPLVVPLPPKANP